MTLVARDQGALDEAAAAIRARRQVNVRTISADLSSDAAVRRVAAEAGELDILVNNAGAIPPGDLLSVDDATWRQAWDLKVFGYISFCRVVYAQMKARAGGRDRQRDRRGGRELPHRLYRRCGGQRVADGVHPRAGQGRAGRRAARGGDQSRAGGDRSAGHAAARRGAGEVRRSGALARADGGHAVRPRGVAAGDRAMRWRFWPARCPATRPGRC